MIPGSPVLSSFAHRLGTFILRPRVMLVLALGWFGASVIDNATFLVDDTFIPMRYAENLAQGNGLVYNVGERVEGYSDLIWTLMLGGAAKAGVNQSLSPIALLIFAKCMGVFFGIATIAALAWFLSCIRKVDATRDRTALLSLALIGVPASLSFDLWSVSGMETSMCAFFTTLTAALMYRGMAEIDNGATRAPLSLFIGAVTLVIATTVRPEQTFYWGGGAHRSCDHDEA